MNQARTQSGVSPFAEGVHQFCRQFVQTVSSSAKKQEENLVCSPLSCLIALAMTQAGAKGRTLENMTKALCLPEDLKETHQSFAELVSELIQAQGAIDLTLANRVYLTNNEGFKIKEDYLATLKKTFNASALAVNFLDSATADSINKWVETQTKNKIRNLVGPGSFDSDTSLVLINTLYFKCDWLRTFLAKPAKFYLNEMNTVEVPFMYQTDYFSFKKLPELDARLLQIPYEHKDFSFVIILPKEKTGLADLEGKLATKNLAELLLQAYDERVEVSLPKFKFETTLDLKEAIIKMGMENAFDQFSADFTGITKTGRPFISDVLQKAFIEVNEKGTEAAFATMITLPRFGGGSSSDVEDEKFNCTHPFAFFIVYKSKYTLVAGSMNNPASAQAPAK